MLRGWWRGDLDELDDLEGAVLAEVEVAVWCALVCAKVVGGCERVGGVHVADVCVLHGRVRCRRVGARAGVRTGCVWGAHGSRGGGGDAGSGEGEWVSGRGRRRII